MGLFVSLFCAAAFGNGRRRAFSPPMHDTNAKYWLGLMVNDLDPDSATLRLVDIVEPSASWYARVATWCFDGSRFTPGTWEITGAPLTLFGWFVATTPDNSGRVLLTEPLRMCVSMNLIRYATSAIRAVMWRKYGPWIVRATDRVDIHPGWPTGCPPPDQLLFCSPITGHAAAQMAGC